MDLYRSGAVTPVARKRPTGAPAPPLIGRPSGGFTTAFRMSAHRHASTVPVRRRLPPQTRGHCGLHGGPRRATRRLRRVFRRYASKPVLSRRRSPCPRGATAARLRSRVSLVGHSERLSETAGKKCVSKCATQFLLIGGNLDALRAGPHRRARRADRECQFPPQFPPLWKPPFPDPPSKLESTKGGETAGGTGTAASMARLGKPPGPQPQRSRAPPPSRVAGPLHRSSPLRRGPQGPGAQSGRNAVRALTTISALQGVRKLTNVQRLRLDPLAPFAPSRLRE